MKNFLILFLLISQYTFAKAYKSTVLIADLPPWIEVNNSSCESGPICDFYKQLSLQVGINIGYEVSSLARVNLAAYKGELDMALFPKLPVFDEHYDVMGKVYNYSLGHYIRRDVKSSRKCTTPKNPHMKKGVKYLEVSDLNQCFKMLMNKRIGGILVTDIELALFLSKKPSYAIGEFSFTKKLSLWLYVNKKMAKDTKVAVQNFFKTYDDQPIQNKYLIKEK